MTDKRTASPLSYLFICDEWFFETGGISVFNRKLAKAVAGCGNPTTYLVETASETEHLDAAAHGVRLIVTETTPAGPDLHLPVAEILSAATDVAVGHDRITRHIAWLYAGQYAESTLVHIQHTAPAEIEPYKDITSAGSKVDAREAVLRSVAESAAVVASVGLRLARYAGQVLGDGYREVPVLRFDPGIDMDTGTVHRRRQVPVRPNVLVLGRTGDVALMGLDIAATASEIGWLSDRFAPAAAAERSSCPVPSCFVPQDDGANPQVKDSSCGAPTLAVFGIGASVEMLGR